MKFGTLQSFAKEPVKDFDNEDIADIEGIDGEGDDELDLDMDSLDNPGDDELDLDALDSPEENPVISKLLTLKREIDEILSDMGYASEDEEGSEFGDEDFDFGTDGDESSGANDDFQFDFDDDGSADPEGEEENQEGEFGDEGENADFPSEKEGLGEPTDDNYQGNIRTVAGADLVYKRKTEDGNFEELWIYTVGNDIRKETQIRKAILAGTDIVPSQRESEDGEQRSETTTLGNVQYLKINGIPN